jgi:hypothetical protein
LHFFCDFFFVPGMVATKMATGLTSQRLPFREARWLFR